MAAPFEVTNNGTETTLLVRGSLDINTAPALAEEIDKIVAAKPTKVICDLTGLDLIDSSGVAALVKLYKGVKSAGAAITIFGARDQPLAIFKLLRMDKVFNF
jgi:anti-sigma B factor antagonist